MTAYDALVKIFLKVRFQNVIFFYEIAVQNRSFVYIAVFTIYLQGLPAQNYTSLLNTLQKF